MTKSVSLASLAHQLFIDIPPQYSTPGIGMLIGASLRIPVVAIEVIAVCILIETRVN